VTVLKTASATTVATVPFTTLDLGGNPAAGSLAIGNTAAGLVPVAGSAGFPAISAFSGANTGYLYSVQFGSSVACRETLFDRLFHAGSVLLTALATTTLSAQPSYAARLPGTNYNGLGIFLEVNAAVSATATTVSVGYTNQAGTAGRSTGATGSLSGFTTRRLIPMPLQAGDTGVQKIDSVTVGGTVATAGSVNVIVARRLWSNRVSIANDGGLDGPDRTGLIVIMPNTALWLVVQTDSTSSGIPELLITLAEG
jgi:hypothetical protein